MKTFFTHFFHHNHTIFKMDNKIIISLSANIAAGKTTLLRAVTKRLVEKGLKNIAVLYEPVAKWESIKEKDVGLLEMFYADKKRFAHTFQMAALDTRAGEIEFAQRSFDVVLTERSPNDDRFVFAQQLFEDGDLTQMELDLNDIHRDLWHRKFEHQIKCIIFLDVDANECFERMKSRSRNSETSVKLDYLKRLEATQRKWLASQSNVVNLDGNCKIGSIEYNNNVEKIVEIVETHLKKNEKNWVRQFFSRATRWFWFSLSQVNSFHQRHDFGKC